MDDTVLEELQVIAREVLANNDRGQWTMPAANLYPHQWLWDSCFISIGLRHINLERAKTELRGLLRGQWSNGMLPNMIFADGKAYRNDINLWRSWVNPSAPDNVATSGITQPPLLAEAVYMLGQKMKLAERRSWFKEMLPPLISYHEWLYNERDPHKEGLILLLHPYECGMDDTPPWVSELHKHSMPLWIRMMQKARLGWIITAVRRDTQHVTLSQRMDPYDAAAYWAALLRLRRKAYNSEALLPRSLFAVEDLGFNCIFIRANNRLKQIAKTAGYELSDELKGNMKNTEAALEQLWDESSGQYYSRSFVSHKLIEEPSIATLLPLYSGVLPPERVSRLVELLKRQRQFSTSWPVPSIPINSPYFNAYKYWQGPAWVNTNWLIINGLRQYGYEAEASVIKDQTIKMVAKNGMYEYFNPLNGKGAGAPNFSWTAALVIDLIKS